MAKWEVKNVNGQRGYSAFDWYQVQLMSNGFTKQRGPKFRFGQIAEAQKEADRRNAEMHQAQPAA